MTNTAVYYRVSTARQEREATIETQTMAVEQFCERNGLEITHVFKDEAVSGTVPFETREGGMSLLEAVKQGLVTHVVMYAIDRISRDDIDCGLALRLLEDKLKLTVVFADGTDSEEARDMKRMLAKWERKAIRARTMGGRYRRVVRDLKYQASHTPFGYQAILCDCPDRRRCNVAEHGTLVPHPEHAEIVEQMFDWALAGDGLRVIANRLEEMGVELPLPPGKAAKAKRRGWHTTTVYKLLKSPRYCGKATYAGNPMRCPALVSEETFEAVQHQLRERGKKMTGPVKTKHPYLLRRLAYCRHCEGPCRAKTEGERRIYECRNRAIYPAQRDEHQGVRRRFQAHKVERIVKEWIFDLLTDPKRALAQARLYSTGETEARAQKDAERDRIAAKLQALDAQEKRAIDLAVKGLLSDDELAVQRAAVAEERARLEAQRERQSEPGSPRLKGIDPAALRIINRALVVRAAELEIETPTTLDPALKELLLESGDPEKWAREIQMHVRRVWLEPDGKHVTIEGVIPTDEPYSGTIDSFPRSR